MRRPAPQLALLLLSTATLTACRSCRNEHPFVPYRIEAGTVATDAAADAAARAEDAAPLAQAVRQSAVTAPPHATTWTLAGHALTAPPGTTFTSGLAFDLDGDGAEDVVALVAEADEAAREDLVLYRGAPGGLNPAETVTMPPGASPPALDPRCTRVEHLARVGRHSVALELGQACPKGLAERVSRRLIAQLAWSGSLRARVAFEVVDPADAPALAFELDGADIDGDGLDDVSLRVTLDGGGAPFEPNPAVHAAFRWFDRPAGMSREPGEPERSFHAIAALASAKGAKAKDAASAVTLASAGRALFQAVCAESNGRRVAPLPEESPLSCEAGPALEALALAAVRAHVTEGDPLRAIAALDDAELPPASHTAARVTEAEGWITTLAPVVQATEVRAISAVPRVGAEAASWGALRFEPSGALLVRTLAGVARVDPVHGDEGDAPGVVAWPTKVTSPDGKVQFEGAFAPCRGRSLMALLATKDGADADAIALPIATDVAPHCTGDEKLPVAAVPIAWGSGGLEVAVAGDTVLIDATTQRATPLLKALEAPVTPGAPRSPDGSVLVVPTSRGILVVAKKARLLRAKELEHGYGELRDCTVSDDASRVACVRGGIAFVGVWPPP